MDSGGGPTAHFLRDGGRGRSCPPPPSPSPALPAPSPSVGCRGPRGRGGERAGRRGGAGWAPWLRCERVRCGLRRGAERSGAERSSPAQPSAARRGHTRAGGWRWLPARLVLGLRPSCGRAGPWPGLWGSPPRRAAGGSGGGASRAVRAMSGGPPKALPSTGPQSLRDMPHPLAGSSSEEAVGGDSTPSPDLLTARSFGDKVGRAGLGTGRFVSLPSGMRDLDLVPAGHRAAPTLAPLSGGQACPRPRALGKKRLLPTAPSGLQPLAERPEGTGLPGWSRGQ